MGTSRWSRGRRRARAKLGPWPIIGVALISSAGCAEDTTLVSVQPDIEVVPPPGTLLTWDEVVLGVNEPADPRILLVRNVGDGVLDLWSATVEGEGADQIRVSSFPERLPPGAVGELFVRFEPTLTGTTTADLVVRTNDLDERELRWPLLGPARDPCRLRVSPTHQVFVLGEVRTVRIAAASSHYCDVTQLSTDVELFAFLDAPELPFRIPAGEERILQIRHVDGTVQPGRPIRQLRVREAEGTEATVSLEGEEPLYGCLDIGPERLTYDVIPTNQVGVREFTVWNRCAEPAMITNAAVSVGYRHYRIVGEFPMTVPPREQVRIPVEYRPFSTRGDGGYVTVLTNDALVPRARIELQGRAARGVVDVFPKRLDFGTVAFRNPQGDELRSECSSSPRLVQVFSSGGSAVTVSDLYVDPAGDALFQIASVTVGGLPVDFSRPIVIPGNEEMRVSLIFYPTRTNPARHEATLVIEHDVGVGRSEVLLSGTGSDDGEAEDVFTQLPGPKTDILWVIDNSFSMFDEQARLQQNLSQFVGYADALDSDYQMAVTPTDHESPDAGKLERCFPHPAIVSSDYEDTTTRDAAFRCMFDVGVNGPGNEGGLGAAKKALERALDPELPNNANYGLLRDDANLAIVIVSDENDGTELSLNVLYNFFVSVKGRRNPERVRVHSIIELGTTREGCDTVFGSPGFRYEAISQRTNGVSFNICQDDWQPVLRDLGLNVFTPIDEWELSRQADPSTLFVTVEGVPVREDARDGWTYDPLGNSVRFHGSALPSPGAEIRVSYRGLCRP